MTETILPGEMKELEQHFMQTHQVPSALLMEHAAQGIISALLRYVPRSSRVLFLCGSGNNGGDGYASARLWQASGGKAWFVACGNSSGDALMNRALALEAGVQEASADVDLSLFDAVVDALFGTGLNRAPEGITCRLIRQVNRSGLPIIAVDCPSGLDTAVGIAPGEVIRATETVTFHRIKQGLLLRDGPLYTGRLVCHPILIPKDYGNSDGLQMLEAEDAVLPSRPATSHKGTMGRVLILAGSPGMTGAAAFCANAAIHAGAGLTRILCRRDILPILQSLVPCATCIILPGNPQEAADTAARALSDADAAVVGCGLGVTPDLLPCLAVFRKAACPVVWDADALNLIAAHRELLPLSEKDMITPHPGEAARLLESSVAGITTDPVRSLEELQHLCGCCVLLKGARSLMTDGHRKAINPIGSPALAKGGSGDVLAGILAAISARKDGPKETLHVLQLGAYLHAQAGLRAAERYGENAVTAIRLIESL